MRSIVIICIMALGFVGAMFAGVIWLKSDGSRTTVSVAKNNFEFSLPRFSGGSFNVKSIQDKVFVVNFWATWCEPCQREFPSFTQLADRIGSDYVFVLISVDENKDDITKFLKAFDGNRPNIEILWDQKSSVVRGFGTNQLPESYIFDKDHKLIRKVIGFENWNSNEVVKYLQQIASAKN